MKKMPPVSIVLSTYNRATIVNKCIKHLLSLNYQKYEIIVINDGSTDNTLQVLKKYERKIRIFNLSKTRGPAYGRNIGISNSSYRIIALIDDDCIVSKQWLKMLVMELLKKHADVATSALTITHASCIKKYVFNKVGLLDINFQFGKNFYPYREDLDLEWRIRDVGYKIVHVEKAKLKHEHPKPQSLREKINFIILATLIHQLDPLLYKKHQKRFKIFFDVKHGIIPPFNDFKRVSGEWPKPTKLSFKELIGTNTLAHKILIFVLSIFYSVCVKFVRLFGSIKYGKILV